MVGVIQLTRGKNNADYTLCTWHVIKLLLLIFAQFNYKVNIETISVKWLLV